MRNQFIITCFNTDLSADYLQVYQCVMLIQHMHANVYLVQAPCITSVVATVTGLKLVEEWFNNRVVTRSITNALKTSTVKCLGCRVSINHYSL